VRALSAHYATLDVGAAADRASVETRLGLNRGLTRRLGLAGQIATSIRRDGGWATSASLTASLASSHGDALAATAGGSDGDLAGPAAQVLISLSLGLGDRTRGAISHQQDGGRIRDRLDVHRTLPPGDGIGYRLAGQVGAHTLVAGELEAKNRVGRYQVGYLQHASGGRVDVSASGGVATVGGRVLPTRSLDRSFVLVRVPAVAGVGVYLDNKPVGHTDVHGDLLVIDALPNYGNRIAIEPADLPDDRPPASTSRLVAPPDRGGVVVTFLAPRLQVVRARLRIEQGDRQLIPAFGEITVGAPASLDDPESQQWTSPLGSDGELEIDGLPPGGYPAVIDWEGGRCELGLDVPVSGRAILDLGVRVCRVAPESAR
jgi:outer membrane usher protein